MEIRDPAGDKTCIAAIRQTPSTRKIENYKGDFAESCMQSYLLSDDELFAHAYAQWVTTKTGVPKLVNTLGFHRGQQSVLKPVQWQDDEFARYIETALDEFFGQL